MLFSYNFSDFQTTSSLLCFVHWSVSPTDVFFFFPSTFQASNKALCDVSTVSFPLQSRRLRSYSCKDRSLEWTSCRDDRSFRFTIPSVQKLLTLMLCLFPCMIVEREKKTGCVCTFVREKQEQNGTKAEYELCCLAFQRLEFLPNHISMTFNLTFNH